MGLVISVVPIDLDDLLTSRTETVYKTVISRIEINQVERLTVFDKVLGSFSRTYS